MSGGTEKLYGILVRNEDRRLREDLARNGGVGPHILTHPPTGERALCGGPGVCRECIINQHEAEAWTRAKDTGNPLRWYRVAAVDHDGASLWGRDGFGGLCRWGQLIDLGLIEPPEE